MVFLLSVSVTSMFATGGTTTSSGNNHNNNAANVSSQSSGAQSRTNQASTQTVHNKAYNDNMIEVEPGVFAIYSGDVNQDGYIGSDDVVSIDNDNLGGISGDYIVTDLNGDTYVGSDDVVVCDNNNLLGLSVQRP